MVPSVYIMNLSFYWSVNIGESIGERYSRVHPYFFRRAQDVLPVLLRVIVRWEVSGCTTAVLLDFTSSICSKQHAASFCSSHLAFSPSASLKTKWCNSILVLTQILLERIPVLFYQRWLDFLMVINLSIAVNILPMHKLTLLSVDEILLPMHMFVV